MLKSRSVCTTFHYHIEVGLDDATSVQIPQNDLPIVTSTQSNAGIHRIVLQYEHLIVVTLSKSQQYHPRFNHTLKNK